MATLVKPGINRDKWSKNTLVFQLRSYRGVIVVYESRRRRGERRTVSSEITTPVSVNQLAFHPCPGSETQGDLVPMAREQFPIELSTYTRDTRFCFIHIYVCVYVSNDKRVDSRCVVELAALQRTAVCLPDICACFIEHPLWTEPRQ